MQVVEVGDPTAIGPLRGDGAACPVDADPGIAAGAGHGDIDLTVRPFPRPSGGVEIDRTLDRFRDAGRQRASFVFGLASNGRRPGASSPLFCTVFGLAEMLAA
ncbi:hypothetical protein GCM10020258_13060 [Sphingomonas yabuuchiae]